MKMKDYKYIVAGAGIFGAIVAERLASRGENVLVAEKRDHIAGNIYSYTDEETGIEVHKYGSHIFTPSTKMSGSTSPNLPSLTTTLTP